MKGGQVDRWTDEHMVRRTDGVTFRLTDPPTDIQTDGETDIISSWTDRQTDRRAAVLSGGIVLRVGGQTDADRRRQMQADA